MSTVPFNGASPLVNSLSYYLSTHPDLPSLTVIRWFAPLTWMEEEPCNWKRTISVLRENIRRGHFCHMINGHSSSAYSKCKFHVLEERPGTKVWSLSSILQCGLIWNIQFHTRGDLFSCWLEHLDPSSIESSHLTDLLYHIQSIL
jgi:hypothetical protein